MDNDGVTPIENFTYTKTYITLKNHHTWGFSVYVLDARLQCNIAVLVKWEPCSCLGIIYIGQSPFHAGPLALVLNPATGRVSPQFHVVFYDEFSTVPFMREVTIPQNWTYLVQNTSQNSALDNIDLTYTWFTPDLEEEPRKTPKQKTEHFSR